ncbi:MFS transporter [Chryseobacterium indologenes]|uniref:MFS transporter n=2 Tax=Chryseobacterium indologenes TaxID=253 RepID=UPI0003E08560|nr:MFS transporter [Chryseobacterium indologenes]MEB4762690.1 MFS transporter [Chryseobacterium indologenes]QQQ70140.1 MFS transporter [Chryseobacterium indologenes]GAE66277.1 putative major facilitator superfamily transporter [Chryseobacterium indologenes NBRC 14944]
MEMPTFTRPRQLNKHDIRTLILSSFGGMLEFYDFVVFIFFAKIIGEHFFPPTLDSFWASMNTYGTFAAGFFVRPVGGMIMAHFGDLFGRKKMFFLSIVLMVFPTLAIGFLPTYQQIGYFAPILLLVVRILQGFAIGGEIPAAWVFVAEHVPGNRVGLADSMITASLSMGVLLGSAITLYINTSFSAEEIFNGAWRYPFILGGLFGIITIFLRRYLKETPVFIEMKEKKTLSEKIPLQKIFQSHLPDISFSLLLTWIFTGCSILLTLMIPNLMSDFFSIPRKDAITMQSYTLISISLGAVLGGMMCDRKGAGRMLMLWSTCFGICSWFFLQKLIHMKPEGLSILYATTGLFAGGVLGCIPYIMIHRFPASVRISGISFSYNLGQAIFGGITPMIIILMAKDYPQGILFYVLFLAVLGIYLGWRTLVKNKKKI